MELMNDSLSCWCPKEKKGRYPHDIYIFRQNNVYGSEKIIPQYKGLY